MAYGGGFRRGGSFNRGPRRDFGPREMHKIKCSECGKEDEVPFKPSGDRPVFCKACFMKSKGLEPRSDFEPKAPKKEEASEETEESETMEEEAEDEEEMKDAA